MKGIFAEESILFLSLVKWFFLAALVGVIVGISTRIFLWLLEWGIGVGQFHARYFLLLPFAMFFSSLLIKYLAPEARGHGRDKVIEAIHKNSGKIDIKSVPIKLLTTVMTIACGGSAGKEGPAAHIGSALSSFFAGVLKFSDRERKKIVVCGISASYSAVFGTPIAGAIFGLEILVAGVIVHEDLFPSFVAGIISYQIASFLGVVYHISEIGINLQFDNGIFFVVVLSGIFFGLCSLYFIEIINLAKKLFKLIKIWEPLKALIAGILIVSLALLFSDKYLGLGTETVDSLLRGNNIVWYAFLLKGLLTALTLEFGGSGGVISPIFFIGTAAGAMFA